MTTPTPLPEPTRRSLSEFDHVDTAAHPEAYVRFLKRMMGKGVSARQQLSYELLGASEGMRLLDVGCGIGDDVRTLAGLVGATGAVVGLDNSETMLAHAKALSEGKPDPGEFIQGDMLHLPFADASFDGCRTERVLIHSADPAQALAEMARVTRAGGMVVVTEPDLETLTYHASQHDLVRRLGLWHCEHVRHGRIGRYLPEMFLQAGLTDIRSMPTVAQSATLSNYPLRLVDRATRHNLLSAEEAEDLIAEWRRRDADGTFLEYGVYFTVAGRKG
jgi:ubiquinone/menaquinone biosynthesis C-methylase UbiE